MEFGVPRVPPYTFQLPGTKLTDGLTILFIRDPDGILVELVERPRVGRQ
jgi:catechol 2,3-dioxygenase-like lactoylglutathione lyase family enzyme